MPTSNPQPQQKETTPPVRIELRLGSDWFLFCVLIAIMMASISIVYYYTFLLPRQEMAVLQEMSDIRKAIIPTSGASQGAIQQQQIQIPDINSLFPQQRQ